MKAVRFGRSLFGAIRCARVRVRVKAPASLAQTIYSRLRAGALECTRVAARRAHIVPHRTKENRSAPQSHSCVLGNAANNMAAEDVVVVVDVRINAARA